MRKLIIDLLINLAARILVDRWHVNKFSCVLLSSYLVPIPLVNEGKQISAHGIESFRVQANACNRTA